MAAGDHASSPKRTAAQRRQASNKATGYVIPCLVFAVVVYSSYALIAEVVVDYYLAPSDGKSNIGPGVAILVIHILLLIILALSYLRLLSTSILRRRTPDDYCPKHEVAPLGTHTSFMADRSPPQVKLPNICLTDADRVKLKPTTEDPEKGPTGPGQYLSVLDHEAILSGTIDPPPGLDDYYARDVFQCDPRGLPRWCGSCNNWKPDRVHHSEDVGRCVANFDHFCPWVGGAVAESNYKFFVQFIFYTFVYTAFIVIVVACTLSDRTKNHPARSVNPHHIVLLGLAGFFWTFAFGMLGTCVQHMTKNTTTVDAIDASNRTMYLAVRIPETFNGPFPAVYTPPSAPPVGSPATSPPPIPIWQNVLAYPISSTQQASSASKTSSTPTPDSLKRHSFAVFQTPRGLNPWDLGARRNLCQVMGYKWSEWLLPLKRSPNTAHGTASAYPLGPDFESMKQDVFEGKRE